MLSLSNRGDVNVTTVAADGEIDVSTVDQLNGEILAAVHADAPTVVVDLSGVTFIDSAGIGALLRGRRLADEQQKEYRVTGAEGLVRQVLDITGVWVHLSGQTG